MISKPTAISDRTTTGTGSTLLLKDCKAEQHQQLEATTDASVLRTPQSKVTYLMSMFRRMVKSQCSLFSTAEEKKHAVEAIET